MVSEKVAANEEIRETQIELGLGGAAHPLPFLCECDDVRCRDLVRLHAQEYVSVRAAPARRIVAEGHPYGGRIIAGGPGYVITEVEMDERARRIGENEALYRSVNEKIEGLNESFGVIAESMAVVCECGSLECTEQITVDIPMYEHVRSDPTFFVLVPGHEEPDVETIIEEHGAFNVVRKDPGEPAEVARKLA